jgi:hypothetical protein
MGQPWWKWYGRGGQAAACQKKGEGPGCAYHPDTFKPSGKAAIFFGLLLLEFFFHSSPFGFLITNIPQSASVPVFYV